MSALLPLAASALCEDWIIDMQQPRLSNIQEESNYTFK